MNKNEKKKLIITKMIQFIQDMPTDFESIINSVNIEIPDTEEFYELLDELEYGE